MFSPELLIKNWEAIPSLLTVLLCSDLSRKPGPTSPSHPQHLSRTQITATVGDGLATTKLPEFRPTGTGCYGIPNYYEGRVCLANSVKKFYFGENCKLKVQTVSKCSDTIYIPTGKMLFFTRGPSSFQSRPGHASPREAFVSWGSDFLWDGGTVALGTFDA